MGEKKRIAAIKEAAVKQEAIRLEEWKKVHPGETPPEPSSAHPEKTISLDLDVNAELRQYFDLTEKQWHDVNTKPHVRLALKRRLDLKLGRRVTVKLSSRERRSALALKQLEHQARMGQPLPKEIVSAAISGIEKLERSEKFIDPSIDDSDLDVDIPGFKNKKGGGDV